jgi:DNA-directed RNA polymerase specialized sigma24 family protein
MAKYVNNKRFNDLLKEYEETKSSHAFNEIGKIFLLIAQNLLNKTNFINYTQDRKEEMVSDATYFMTKYVDRYDTSKKNPFSYFTRVAYNAFLQNINDYNRRDEMFRPIEYIENFDNGIGSGQLYE